jgi:predicted Zn-dependent protease with MMP-like domain
MTMAKVPPHSREPRMRVSRRRFERAVRQALATVPEGFRPYLAEIEFVTVDVSERGLLGLYEGAGALGGSDWPTRITIYRRAHAERCRSWRELVDEVRRTVLHEIGHHFQMEEHDLPY